MQQKAMGVMQINFVNLFNSVVYKIYPIMRKYYFQQYERLATDIHRTVKLFSRLNANKIHKKRQNIFM